MQEGRGSSSLPPPGLLASHTTPRYLDPVPTRPNSCLEAPCPFHLFPLSLLQLQGLAGARSGRVESVWSAEIPGAGREGNTPTVASITPGLMGVVRLIWGRGVNGGGREGDWGGRGVIQGSGGQFGGQQRQQPSSPTPTPSPVPSLFPPLIWSRTPLPHAPLCLASPSPLHPPSSFNPSPPTCYPAVHQDHRVLDNS